MSQRIAGIARAVGCVIAVGCASGGSQQPGPSARTRSAPPRPDHGEHGGVITSLALTDDGGAAVTQDGFAGTRLWPTLDGRVEPIAIAVPQARALAIARDGDGFAIAAVDEAATLTVVAVAGDGRERARTQPATEVVQVEAVDNTFLAVRSDETILRCDLRGRPSGRLPVPSGQRLVHLLVRHGRALALLAGKTVSGRWIDLAHFTWGDQTSVVSAASGGAAAEVAASGMAALSPDGALLALGGFDGIRVVELATGKIRARGLCPQGPVLVGFVEAETIACLEGRLDWFGLDGKPKPGPGAVAHTVEAAAVGDGIAIASDDHSLALRTATGAHYLGYAFGAITEARTTPGGIMITSADGAPLELGRELALTRALPVPAGSTAMALPIDDRFAITSLLEPFGDRLAVVELASGHVHQELIGGLRPRALDYDPTTHWLAGIDEDGGVVHRYDPATGLFGEGVRLASDAVRIELLDPALADGDAVAVVQSRDHMMEVATYRDADLRAGARVAPRRTYMTYPPIHAIDRAGRAYVEDSEALVIDAGNEHVRARIGSLPKLRAVAPSPDGKQFAVLYDGALAMFDATGARRWRIAEDNAARMMWSFGALYLQLPTSVVQLDAAAGEQTLAVCGWKFGLTDDPPPAAPDLPSVCDAR